MKQVLANIISNTELMPDYHLICVEAPDIVAAASPGQFIMVKCDEKLVLRRPLSIHRIDNSNQLSILFAVVGRGTQWLSQHQKDEKLNLLGPLGNGFHIEQASRNLLLVAGGIGVTPLVFLAQQALKQDKSVKMLLGARTKDGLYPRERLPDRIEIEATTEDGSSGRKGMVSDVFVNYIDWADQIYACGPNAMYKTMANQMRQQLVKKPVQISLEVRMGCGLGACFGCSIKTKRGMKKVCRDGPVFNLDEVPLSEVKI
ncbi:MAG: dihydroorotate dehydrogenase electron transfer subunit [Chloroflexi bacterium]|nr:dihydroorotate dehydrogenase electron transfer subunit [Chloroflexota bacterium]